MVKKKETMSNLFYIYDRNKNEYFKRRVNRYDRTTRKWNIVELRFTDDIFSANSYKCIENAAAALSDFSKSLDKKTKRDLVIVKVDYQPVISEYIEIKDFTKEYNVKRRIWSRKYGYRVSEFLAHLSRDDADIKDFRYIAVPLDDRDDFKDRALTYIPHSEWYSGYSKVKRKASGKVRVFNPNLAFENKEDMTLFFLENPFNKRFAVIDRKADIDMTSEEFLKNQ